MKKNIKFNQSQAQLIEKSLDAFKNETVKNVAKSYFGGEGTLASHSKGTYTQSYSRNADIDPILVGGGSNA